MAAHSNGSALCERARQVLTDRVWLVSGTPFSTSISQLAAQAPLLACRSPENAVGDLNLVGLPGHIFAVREPLATTCLSTRTATNSALANPHCPLRFARLATSISSTGCARE